MVATCRKFRRTSLTCVSLLALALATNVRAEEAASPPAEAAPGHNNVAALYCLTLGYSVAVIQREPDAGQMGMCVFPDDSSCPEWDFYAGTCGAQWSLCARRQLEQRNKSDGGDTYAASYTACVVDGVEVPVSEILGFPHRFNTTIGPVIGIRGPTSPATSTPVTPARPHRTPPAPGTKSAAPQAPNVLPSAFTWRNEGGSDWMTSVKDQSQCGSCWAFSAVGATEAVFNIDRNNPGFDLDLSEELLNGGSAGSCCGGWHYSALDIIKNSGIPDEACLPYDVGYYNTAGCDCFGSPPCNASCTGLPAECSNLLPGDACVDMGARLTTIADYFAVPSDIDTIKTRLIDEGPLSVCYAHQGRWNGNVYECPWGWCRSATSSPGIACTGAGDPVCPSGTTCQALSMNHCVVLAGYDDNGGNGFWVLKNSWGAGFDGDGYFNLRYDNCLIQNAAYYVDPGTTPNRPPVAVCAAVVKSADPDCCATVTASDADGGSHDPDGAADIVTRCITRSDGMAVACLPEVEVCGAGSHTVELTVRDAQGESSSCLASVTLQDVTPPEITCPPDRVLECPANIDPSVTGQATATDNCSIPSLGHADAVTPGCGGTRTVVRTWTAEDDAGNDESCPQTIAVVDTTPPDVTCSVARSELWPPNHKFVNVDFEFTATDTCDPGAPASVIRVTSDEDTAGAGSGGPNHCPDAVVSGGEVSLRAERAGGGDGRVYTVHVTGTDDCGNAASCEETVGVPKAQGGNHVAPVDSGQSFDAMVCDPGASQERVRRERPETRRSRRP